MSNYDLTDKVVLVAGGGKNLGGLISREFAGKGSNVIVHYHSQSSQQEAEATVRAVQKLGREAFSVQSDLTRTENIAALFESKPRNNLAA